MKQQKNTMIVCTVDGQPLDKEDQKALDAYIEYRRKRAEKAKKSYHLVFLKDGTNYVCKCKTRLKDHAWRKDTL